jgi:hypothetical protein
MSDFLAFAGAPGERNLVGLQAIVDAVPGGFSWLVDDAGAPLVAGVGCVSLDIHTARCEEAADLTSSLPLASVALGDMDDNLTASADDAVGALLLPTVIAEVAPAEIDLWVPTAPLTSFAAARAATSSSAVASGPMRWPAARARTGSSAVTRGIPSTETAGRTAWTAATGTTR